MLLVEDVDAVCANCKIHERAKSANNRIEYPVQPIRGGFQSQNGGSAATSRTEYTPRGEQKLKVPIRVYVLEMDMAEIRENTMIAPFHR